MHPGHRSSLAAAFAIAAATITGACKGHDEAPVAPPPPATVVYDAAPPDGVTTIGGYDPSSGMHLDDDTPGSAPGVGGAGVRNHRTLEILLRSTPTGATAAVDGVIVGQTPTYWEGDFTGREREFTFVLPGYALARYRFVPTTSGVVHGRLTQITSEQDGGVPAIPQPVDLAPLPPPRHPDAAPPRPPDAPPPPPPPDAAPAPAPAPTGGDTLNPFGDHVDAAT